MSDFALAQNANGPVTFRIRGVDLTGFALALRLKWRDGARDYALGAGLTMTVEGAGETLASIVLWSYPLADAASLPEGRRTRWELSWSAGGVTSAVAGMINVAADV